MTTSRRVLAAAGLCLLVVGSIAEESRGGEALESACGVDASCCSVVEAVAEEDAAAPLAVELLQRGIRASRVSAGGGGEGVAALRRDSPTNATALWNQVRGAVHIDELQKKLANVKDSDQAQQLDQKLQILRAQYPAADEVKETLAGDWHKLEEIITLENVKGALEEAKHVGDMATGQLEKEYEGLKGRWPFWKSEEVKQNATDTWSQVKAQGVPLPDLGSLEGTLEMEAQTMWNQGMDIAGKAGSSIGNAASSAGSTVAGAASSAGSSVASAASSAGQTMSNWWR